MVVQRSIHVGPESRPVEFPNDLFSGDFRRAAGIIRLPNHIFWRGEPLDFDLSNLRDRVRVYELLLTEGNIDDIRFSIDPVELVKL
jgi:hypothetical protein